jgi:hypothetical protein
MSNTIDMNTNQPSDQSIALFLHDNDPDKLTDILVEALSEALRILEEDFCPAPGIDTLH